MRHLFTPDGEAALAETLRRHPLLAFDFDGTLAPIVPTPDSARISQAVAARLRRLSTVRPVAIVTGRSVEDVLGRLGFEPLFVIGNHGAQDSAEPAASSARARALDPLRDRLRARAPALTGAGIAVEDKGQSIALHYRLSRDRPRARSLIDDLLAATGGSLRTFESRLAANAVAHDAPDAMRALREAAARCGAGAVLFVGDDANDGSVFRAVPPGWLTVRIRRDDPTSGARYFLDSPSEVAMLLERTLQGTDATARAYAPGRRAGA